MAGDGRLLVADTYNYRVQLLGPNGEPMAAWGWHLFWLWPRPAHGREGFGETASAAFGCGTGLIHVADAKDRRVVMLDEHGNFVSELHIPDSAGKAQTPIQVAVSPDGRTVYATDIANNRVLVLAVDFATTETKEKTP